MSILFVGIVPPRIDTPLIELETPDGSLLDLYNEGWLRSVTIEKGELIFSFRMSDEAGVSVTFGSVRNLRVRQPPDWAPEEADQIEHLLIRREGQSPRIVFVAGGLSYEFDAAEVAVERTLEPEGG
jgi:hypothetical protein